MKALLSLFLILMCQNVFCQKDGSSEPNLVLIKKVNDTPPKSKSRCTPKPTVINVKRSDIKDFTRIQDFIPQIPANCDVLSFELNWKEKGKESLIIATNIGNNLLHCRPTQCKFIIFENIVSNCPTVHNANYKIMIQD